MRINRISQGGSFLCAAGGCRKKHKQQQNGCQEFLHCFCLLLPKERISEVLELFDAAARVSCGSAGAGAGECPPGRYHFMPRITIVTETEVSHCFIPERYNPIRSSYL